MSLGKILVPLDGSDQDDVSLVTAIRAAKPFHAHVVAFFAHPDPAEAMPIIGVPLNAEAMSAVIDGNTRIFRAKAKRIHDAMARVGASESARLVDAPYRQNVVTLSYREAIGYPPHLVSSAAALADLVVCAPADKAPQLFETSIDLILQQRRPILLASSPPAAFRKVVIGWDGSAAATRALSAAMPLLEKADIVELICVEQAIGQSFDTEPAIAYLKAHGISPSEVHLGRWDALPHDALTKLAVEHNADLLVIGAFGHSRIRETFFGGVTNETLCRPPLPVFLAH
ncbi:MAG TPA: universal stress protein [Rhizomicrobium sp.]